MGRKVNVGRERNYVSSKQELYFHNTVFKAEAKAIVKSLKCLCKNMDPRKMNIHTDRQSTILAIESETVTSWAVLDCKK